MHIMDILCLILNIVFEGNILLSLRDHCALLQHTNAYGIMEEH